MTLARYIGTLVAVCAAALVAVRTGVVAQEAVRAPDRAALSACLSAAEAARKPAESCIGTVQDRCMKMPGGDTTIGMSDCTGREAAAWDERLNAAYKAALAGDLGQQDATGRGGRKLKGADLLREAQRAWITFRDAKCDAARLPMEGGTGAGLLAGSCHLQETARQALWLEALRQP